MESLAFILVVACALNVGFAFAPGLSRGARWFGRLLWNVLNNGS